MLYKARRGKLSDVSSMSERALIAMVPNLFASTAHMSVCDVLGSTSVCQLATYQAECASASSTVTRPTQRWNCTTCSNRSPSTHSSTEFRAAIIPVKHILASTRWPILRASTYWDGTRKYAATMMPALPRKARWKPDVVFNGPWSPSTGNEELTAFGATIIRSRQNNSAAPMAARIPMPNSSPTVVSDGMPPALDACSNVATQVSCLPLLWPEIPVLQPQRVHDVISTTKFPLSRVG